MTRQWMYMSRPAMAVRFFIGLMLAGPWGTHWRDNSLKMILRQRWWNKGKVVLYCVCFFKTPQRWHALIYSDGKLLSSDSILDCLTKIFSQSPQKRKDKNSNNRKPGSESSSSADQFSSSSFVLSTLSEPGTHVPSYYLLLPPPPCSVIASDKH